MKNARTSSATAPGGNKYQRYEWLITSLSTLLLGLAIQWQLLFGGVPWHR